MIHPKHLLGMVGFTAVIALVIMASASAALALTPKYLIAKKAVPAGLNASFHLKAVGRTTILVSALNIEFNCEKISANGLITSGTHAEVELFYEECAILEKNPPLAELPCKIKNSKKMTANALLLPTELTNGEPAMLFEKVTGLAGMESGTGCPIPLDSTFSGDFCAKVQNNDTVTPRLLMSEAIQKECKERINLGGAEGAGFKDKYSYGAQEAFIDATFEMSLLGTHSGLTLGVSLQ